MDNINAVNVYSIDEEKLKFRVIIAIAGELYRQANIAAAPVVVGAVVDGDGQYEINIPVPTFIANNDKYSQCRIKCDAFAAGAGVPAAGGAAPAAPTWATAGAAGAAVGLAAPAIELQLSAASAQTGTAVINAAVGAAGDKNSPVQEISGFRQLIPGQVVNVGTGADFTPAAGGFGWLGMQRDSSALLCSNPFGQKLRVRFVDPLSRLKTCICNNGALVGGDVGKYFIQLEVTMIPN